MVDLNLLFSLAIWVGSPFAVEDVASYILPLVLQVALGQRSHVTVFGDDYPTSDGSCIRDYIHVEDLADAHVRAVEQLRNGDQVQLNLGTGSGFSVKEVINTCEKVTGKSIPFILGPRRSGDPPELIADSSKATSVLGWKPRRSDLRTIVSDAWRWHSTHPKGFDDRRRETSAVLGGEILQPV